LKYDLSLVPTDVLLAELKRRFNVLIFAGVKVMSKKRYATVMQFNPKELTTLGLADQVKTKIREAIDGNSTWAPGIDQDQI